MNIPALRFNFIQNNIQNSTPQNNPPLLQPKYLHQLNADTVCFSATKKENKPVKATKNQPKGYTIETKMAYDYDEKKKQYTQIGKRFMLVLRDIANQLEPYGITFDMDYCKDSIVKGTDSYISKFKRSGESPRDQIRATLFVKDPYDLKLFNDKILPLLEENGYQISSKEKKVNGKVVDTIYDLDIRLANLTEKHKKQLDPKYQNCLGKPQKSGYEDIQLRLEDTLLPKRNRPPIELLIVFGKDYAEAKHDESYYVYDITRALENLLHISKIESPANDSIENRVQEDIKMLKRFLNTEISEPLFSNAKKRNFYNETPEIDIELSENSCRRLSILMTNIIKKTKMYYDEKLNKVSSPKYLNEIAGQIKRTSDYQLRKNKHISKKEIIARQEVIITSILEQQKDDIQVLKNADKRLRETIKKYGVKTANSTSEKSKPE